MINNLIKYTYTEKFPMRKKRKFIVDLLLRDV